MIIYKLPNANAGVITVTNTATLLRDLINTAGSTTVTFPELNAVDLIIEDGDVRMYADGNTPSATKGELLKQGTTYRLRGLNFHDIQLIRAGSSNVAVAVRIGFTDGNDVQDSSAGGGTAGGTVTVDSEFPAAAAMADAASNPTTPSVDARASGFNGTTWDRIRAGLSGVKTAITGYLNNIPYAQYLTSLPTLANNEWHHFLATVSGLLKVSLGDLIAGEDLTNGVMKVEHQYTPSGNLTSDTQVKASAGFVHSVTFAPADATPTAGTITIYNNTSATGTKIFEWSVAATAFIPFTVILDQVCSTGIYVDFTTTADVNVSVSYR